MKETEYIYATDLAKLRIAYAAVTDTLTAYHNEDRRVSIVASLNEWIEELYEKIKCVED